MALPTSCVGGATPPPHPNTAHLGQPTGRAVPRWHCFRKPPVEFISPQFIKCGRTFVLPVARIMLTSCPHVFHVWLLLAMPHELPMVRLPCTHTILLPSNSFVLLGRAWASPTWTVRLCANVIIIRQSSALRRYIHVYCTPCAIYSNTSLEAAWKNFCVSRVRVLQARKQC